MKKTSKDVLRAALLLFVFLAQWTYPQTPAENPSHEVAVVARNFLDDWLRGKRSQKTAGYFSRKYFLTCFTPDSTFSSWQEWQTIFDRLAPHLRRKSSSLSDLVKPSATWSDDPIIIRNEYQSLFTLVSLRDDYFEQFVGGDQFTCNNYGKEIDLEEVKGLNDLYMQTFEFNKERNAKVMLIWAKTAGRWEIISLEAASM